MSNAKNISQRVIVIGFIFCLIAGCLKRIPVVPSENEIVMPEGMKITAINQHGTMIITAGKGLERSYTWAGDTRSVIMWPRKERWGGSYGIYYPGPGNHWKEHDGITRAVVEEGQLNFKSQEDFLCYISKYREKGSYVYNDNGLFVGWVKSSGAGGTLSVRVWQFFINGIKPKKLPGSQNDKIIMECKECTPRTYNYGPKNKF